MTINWKKILFGISDEKLDPYFHLERTEEYKLVEVKEALAKAELPEALHLLSTLPSAAIEPHVIALSARYHRLEEEQLRGILNYQDYQIGLNRLSSDILKLLQLLEKTFQPESTIQEVKANLRQLYLQRLQDKLADRHPINIQCAYSLTGTDWDRAQIAYDDIVLEQKEVSASLERIFDEHRGRLLVIGEPGAGKTSLLLQLADALLQRRENRIPVILNLATWSETYKNFEHWLLETLPRAGSVSKAYAKTLVLEDRLLPLFDGLDEVKAEHRQACLDAIAQYGQVAEHQYVICSRTREYAEIGEAPVYAQIELQPLKAEQIRSELENSTQPEAKFLLHAIEQDPLLAEVVRNPFYFNTTQLLLASMKSYASLGIQARTVAELQVALVEKFVAQQLNTTVKTAFSAEKSRKWLGFMAKKMEENGVVVFELVDLNLGWLERKWPYYFIVFCIYILAGAIANFPLKCLLYLSFSLVWLFFISNKFDSHKKILWRFSRIKKALWFIPIFGLLFLTLEEIGSISGHKLSFSDILLTIGTTMMIIAYLPKLIPLLKEHFLIYISLVIIFLNIDISTQYKIIGLLIAFLFTYGLEKKELYRRTTVYSPFYSAFLNESIYVFALFTLGLQIGFFQKSQSVSGIPILIISVLLGVIPFLLIARHFIVRLILLIEKKLTIRLAKFMKEMDARHFFESPGGSWRFRHKILQDYFTQEYERMERERQN